MAGGRRRGADQRLAVAKADRGRVAAGMDLVVLASDRALDGACRPSPPAASASSRLAPDGRSVTSTWASASRGTIAVRPGLLDPELDPQPLATAPAISATHARRRGRRRRSSGESLRRRPRGSSHAAPRRVKTALIDCKPHCTGWHCNDACGSMGLLSPR
jgi:hypothetical protein